MFRFDIEETGETKDPRSVEDGVSTMDDAQFPIYGLDLVEGRGVAIQKPQPLRFPRTRLHHD